MLGCYDREGKPISDEQFLALKSDRDYCTVRLDRIGDVDISTVWLGLNYNFGTTGPPVIFETMTFGTEDEECYRYATEEEAIENHERIVAQLSLLVEATT